MSSTAKSSSKLISRAKKSDPSKKAANSQQAPEEIYLDLFNANKINQVLEEWGVAVVRMHFSPEQTEQWRSDLVNWMVDVINPDLAKNWNTHNMPYGPRTGMVQSLASHAPTVWQIREAFYPLFCDLWGEKELLTSIDGITVHPPMAQSEDDWPHIDQTVENIKCIQGQVVLTDTTASFRCTPKSHLKHRELLEFNGKVGDKTNWCKFSKKQAEELANKFDYWQIPIHAPAGSVIFWYSNTIHSAKRNDPGDNSWRTVVYVCQRPKAHFNPGEQATLRKAAIEGRTTNHWGNSIFQLRPGFWKQPKRASRIEELTDHPEKLVIEYNDLLKKLTAQEEW